MKIAFVLVSVVFHGLHGFGAEKVVLTIDDLKALVEKKNERVLSKEEELKASKLRRGLLVRSYFPSVELYGAQENFKRGAADSKVQPAYGVEARINLFNGGRDLLANRKAILASERARFERKSVLSEQLGYARELFWESLYLKERLKVLADAQQLNQSNLKSADRRIRSGVATQSDRIEFGMAEVDLRREISKTDLSLSTKLRSLSVILGLEDGTEITLNQKYHHEHNWEGAIKHGHEDHEFLVKPAELRAQELELGAISSSRAYWPKLDVYAGWNQYNQREEDFPKASDRRESVVGLRISISLADAYIGRNEAKAQRAEALALKMESNFLNRELDIHLHAEVAELESLHNQVHDAEENIKKAQKYYSLTQNEYSRGVKNSPDVLGASEKLFDTKLKYLEIIRDFQISKNHVLSKIGK